MRLAIRHTETINYETPSLGTIQVLRLTPRDFQGHYVCDWRIDIDADCKISTNKDAFGNVITSFSMTGPLEKLTIQASGEVETEETHGVVRGTKETVPEGVFLRTDGLPSNLATSAKVIGQVARQQDEPLAVAHALSDTLHAALCQAFPDAIDQPTETGSTDPTDDSSSLNNDGAVARLAGQLVDVGPFDPHMASLLLAHAARRIGLPARLVSGYHVGPSTSGDRESMDMWTEIRVEGFGWVGFDVVAGNCPGSHSVRVANGLAIHDIAAIRIGHYGVPAAYEHGTLVATKIDGQ